MGRNDDNRSIPITLEVPGREPVHATVGVVADLAAGMQLSPPPQGLFGDEEYRPAPALKEMADELIERYDELEWLAGWPIEFLWRKKGGQKGGNLTLGKTQLTSGLVSFYSHATWLIWVAADHCRTFNPRQIEAVVYHELLHPWYGVDEDGEKHPRIRGHEWEGFNQELRRYGAWQASMREIAATVQQMKLWETQEA